LIPQHVPQNKKTSYFRQEFSFRQRVVSFISRKLPPFTYTARSGIAEGLKRRGGLGFVPNRSEHSPEITFLKGLNLAGKVAYDVGGFHGLMTLYFASKAAQVVTYEANAGNLHHILDNLNANGFDNVILRNIALGNSEGLIDITFDESMAGAGSGNPEVAEALAQSTASARCIRVPMTRLDDDVGRFKLPVPDFIKIDIEGMELPALEGMPELLRSRRPDLFIELHGASPRAKRDNAAAVIGFLRHAGYALFNVEAGRTIPATEEPNGSESHIYATAG